MRQNKFLTLSAKGFILLSAFSFLSVSMMAFFNPQSVMDLVNVQLGNTDAFSSIRGVYGGVGLALCIALVYLLRNNLTMGLAFLSLIWGLYAVSRIITVFTEGMLGAFGTQWLCIELTFFSIAVSLFIPLRKQAGAPIA